MLAEFWCDRGCVVELVGFCENEKKEVEFKGGLNAANGGKGVESSGVNATRDHCEPQDFIGFCPRM